MEVPEACVVELESSTTPPPWCQGAPSGARAPQRNARGRPVGAFDSTSRTSLEDASHGEQPLPSHVVLQLRASSSDGDGRQTRKTRSDGDENRKWPGPRGKSAQWLACSRFVKNETLPHSEKGRVKPIYKLLSCSQEARALQHSETNTYGAPLALHRCWLGCGEREGSNKAGTYKFQLTS